MTTQETKDLAITFANVSKLYHTYSTPQHRLLEIISGGRKRYAREIKALDNVSFSLHKGGRLGIIGENGSGKSTLLKVLAGVLTPTSGIVQVSGRISALLELGAGFNPELPGSDNIRQFCMFHGMHSDEIDEAVPEIIKFSELRDAVDHPVKTFSSGMAVRLGFACAVYVKPEILIVDEALSVGDAYFQNKCLHKIKSLLDEGVSFIYVTHAADAIRSLCNQGMWMERGEVRLSGPSSEVGAAYQAEVFRRMVGAGLGAAIHEPCSSSEAASDEDKSISVDHARFKAFEDRVAPLRSGSGEIKILDISLVDPTGVEVDRFEFNQKITIRVFLRALKPVNGKCALSVGITDSFGRQIYHFNSNLKGISVSDVLASASAVVQFEIDAPLCPGEFGINAGIGILELHPTLNDVSVPSIVIDYCAGGSRFVISHPLKPTGEYDLWGLVHCNYNVSLIHLP
jgi:lipopolysaccharide transport system ATP-binding protein